MNPFNAGRFNWLDWFAPVPNGPVLVHPALVGCPTSTPMNTTEFGVRAVIVAVYSPFLLTRKSWEGPAAPTGTVPENSCVWFLDGSTTPPHAVTLAAIAVASASRRKHMGRLSHTPYSRWGRPGGAGGCRSRCRRPAIIKRSAWLASEADRSAWCSASRASFRGRAMTSGVGAGMAATLGCLDMSDHLPSACVDAT